MRTIRTFPLHWLPPPKNELKKLDSFPLGIFVHFHVYVCCMCVHSESVHACRWQRSTSVLGTWEMFNLFIKTMLLTGLEHATNARMFRQPALRIHPFAATGLGIRYRSKQACFFSQHRFWGPNSDPCSCTVNTLPTVPSPISMILKFFD